MQLAWLNVADLIAQAGGDPWEINRSLQAGSPFQISQLAERFHVAGRCTAALPGNKGFMMVGADAGKPIVGAVASTPEGLLNASSTPLVGQMPDTQWPYGPTITDIREEGGKQVISMRVSTYGLTTCDPRTYMTTFSVTPGS